MPTRESGQIYLGGDLDFLQIRNMSGDGYRACRPIPDPYNFEEQIELDLGL